MASAHPAGRDSLGATTRGCLPSVGRGGYNLEFPPHGCAASGTGRSSNGRTRGSGPRYRGSNPCLPAKLPHKDLLGRLAARPVFREAARLALRPRPERFRIPASQPTTSSLATTVLRGIRPNSALVLQGVCGRSPRVCDHSAAIAREALAKTVSEQTTALRPALVADCPSWAGYP